MGNFCDVSGFFLVYVSVSIMETIVLFDLFMCCVWPVPLWSINCCSHRGWISLRSLHYHSEKCAMCGGTLKKRCHRYLCSQDIHFNLSSSHWNKRIYLRRSQTFHNQSSMPRDIAYDFSRQRDSRDGQHHFLLPFPLFT